MCANFQAKRTTLTFSTQICKKKNRFKIGNSENYYQNKNHHPLDTMCANFQAKRTALTLLAQICPKIDLGLQIQKTIVGIRISILEIPCVPIFSQNGEL